MTKMLTLLGVTVVVLIAPSKAQEKKGGVVVHKVSAEALAKEFSEDDKKAATKYDSRPAGGVLIEVTGAFEKAVGKLLYLKTGSKVAVVLRAKDIMGEPQANQIARGVGKFVKFQNDSVLIECQEVELKQIVGE